MDPEQHPRVPDPADGIGDPGAEAAGFRPEEPRAAATVVAARGCRRGGVEVLVLRRTARQRFLPGFVVFPGGAVDAGDARLAVQLFGEAGESLRACAVRELLEEAGLALTSGGLAEADDEAAGHVMLATSPPRIDQLPEISHWIAPEDVPVRFDAHFFAVSAPIDVKPRPDGGEADRAWWARPTDLLEANTSGGCSLYWPTMKVLEGLVGCSDPGDVLAASLPQVEPEVQIV